MKKWQKHIGIVTVLLCYWVTGLLSQAVAQTPSTPILSIASPKDNTTVFGDSITVSFIVGNFSFIDYRQKKIKGKNEGHVHLWIDESNPTQENAEKLLSPSDITIHSLPPGKHQLALEIVQNDHSSYNPPITQTVRFTIHYPPATTVPSPTLADFRQRLKNSITPNVLIGVIGGSLISIGIAVFLLDKRPRV